jgi:CHASE2 domain-containing sensor protein
MTEMSEHRLGYIFGLLGGGLIALGGLLSLASGTVDFAMGRMFNAIDATGDAIVLFVVGGLAMLFAWLSRHDWSSRPLASGVVLVVLSVVGWAVLGVGVNFVAVVGSILVFLAGVLFLLEPAKRAVTTVAAS